MSATNTATESAATGAGKPAQQPAAEERIRVRAYELYQKRGPADGDAESDWYQAEAEIQGSTAKATK